MFQIMSSHGNDKDDLKNADLDPKMRRISELLNLEDSLARISNIEGLDRIGQIKLSAKDLLNIFLNLQLQGKRFMAIGAEGGSLPAIASELFQAAAAWGYEENTKYLDVWISLRHLVLRDDSSDELLKCGPYQTQNLQMSFQNINNLPAMRLRSKNGGSGFANIPQICYCNFEKFDLETRKSIFQTVNMTPTITKLAIASVSKVNNLVISDSRWNLTYESQNEHGIGIVQIFEREGDYHKDRNVKTSTVNHALSFETDLHQALLFHAKRTLKTGSTNIDLKLIFSQFNQTAVDIFGRILKHNRLTNVRYLAHGGYGMTIVTTATMGPCAGKDVVVKLERCKGNVFRESALLREVDVYTHLDKRIKNKAARAFCLGHLQKIFCDWTRDAFSDADSDKGKSDLCSTTSCSPVCLVQMQDDEKTNVVAMGMEYLAGGAARETVERLKSTFISKMELSTKMIS
jgi:hypothetical protein